MNDNQWSDYKEQILNKIDDFSFIFAGLKKQKTGSDGWMIACCPFHNDTNPSFAYNRETGKWACFSGCGKGSAFDFIMQTSGASFKDTLTELGDKLKVPRPNAKESKKPPIREELIKGWIRRLNDEVKRFLREKRGISDDTIKKYEIGWDVKRQRNSIPIRDERGNLVNVRLYNTKKKPKIINYTEGKWKYGSPARLYGLDELVKHEGKQVVLCFKPGATIFTGRGSIPIEEVREGDKVLTHSGVYQRVSRTMRRPYKGTLVGIRPKYVPETIWVTPEHPVWASRGRYCTNQSWNISCDPNCKRKGKAKNCKEDFPLEWIDANDLNPEDVLAYPINKEETQPEALMTLEHGLGDLILSPELWRLVGLMLGDGTVNLHKNGKSYTTVIYMGPKKEKARKWLEEFLAYRLGLNVSSSYRSEYNCWGVRFCDVRISTFLRSFHNEDKEKRIPIWVESLPKHLQYEMLLGLFQTDGHWKKSRNEAIITNTSLELLYSVQRILLRFGVLSSIGLTRPAGINLIMQREYYTKNLYQLVSRRLNGLFHVGRPKESNKREGYWFDNNYVYYRINSLSRETYEGDVFNITVESDNSICSPMLTTHNCEGEFDRLILQQEGFMAVTSTHGCTTFRPEWIKHFKDKDVVVIYDCDKEGQSAVNKIILKAFKTSEIASIKNVLLPLRGSKDDKDVTDYLHTRGFTGTDLKKLIDETPVHEYESEKEDEELLVLESFTEIERKRHINKKVQCEITVSGETSEAFHAVEEFRVTFCAKLKKGECFDCADTIKVPKGSQEYIGSCMSTNVQLIGMLRSFCCKYDQKPALEILKRTTIKEFFCHQKVGRITQTHDEDGEALQIIDGQKQELLEKKVYYLSSRNVKPGNFLATGYIKTHPKTQAVTFLIDNLIPQEDDFQSFDLKKNLHLLTAYRNITWPEILDDLSANVTGVFERDDILTAILLTYCSPLWFRFNGEMIRGWLLSIIIGDSGSGKTQTYSRLSEFVNVGDCFSGLTGTRTGLAYALVEHKQKGWQVRVGRYPANSRKILTLDETQHMPEWDLRAISKAMEEGFLQIDRVKSKGYESMTRLLMICNPRRDQVMDTYSFGCESLKSLFPPTIIRRVDLAVFANSGDINDISFINKKRRKLVPKRITPEMLKAVIYWTWNLTPDQIIFTSDAEDACLEQANEMSQEFGFAVDVPLVAPSDFRNALARLSAAFAAVTLSSSDDFSRLIIEPRHVTMSERLIRSIYTHDNCGLNDYSEIKRIGTQLLDYDDIEKAFLDKKENEKHDYKNEAIFSRIIYILRINDRVRRDDLAEQAGCSIEPIRKTIRILKRFNLIDSGMKGYVKKPKFNKFLRRFLRKNPDFFSDE